MNGSARLARALTNTLNPFTIFTALFSWLAFQQPSPARAFLYIAAELFAAVLVAGYVFLRRRRRGTDFWLSKRAERLIPAIILLSVFVGLLGALYLLRAPDVLFRTALSMGLASAVVAALTLRWKASAHAAVAGHAATVGMITLGVLGGVFLLVLPAVIWSRIALKAHTPPQTLAGAAIGAFFAALVLLA